MQLPLFLLFELRENEDYRPVPWKFLQDDGTPFNFTGQTAQLMVREAVTDASPVLTLSNGSGITLGGVAGTLEIEITAAQCSFLATQGLERYGRGVFNLIITDTIGDKLTYFEGFVTVKRSPTR